MTQVHFSSGIVHCSRIEEEAFCISHQVFDGKCLQKFRTEFAVYIQPAFKKPFKKPQSFLERYVG